MLIFVQLLFCSLGMIYLSLTIPRHFSEVSGKRQHSANSNLKYTLIGFVILLLTLVNAIVCWGVLLGCVYWCAVLTMSACIVVGLLSKVPKILGIFIF